MIQNLMIQNLMSFKQSIKVFSLGLIFLFSESCMLSGGTGTLNRCSCQFSASGDLTESAYGEFTTAYNSGGFSGTCISDGEGVLGTVLISTTAYGGPGTYVIDRSINNMWFSLNGSYVSQTTSTSCQFIVTDTLQGSFTCNGLVKASSPTKTINLVGSYECRY